MTQSNNKNKALQPLLGNLDKILVDSVASSMAASRGKLTEAYVAEPKQFKQVSELVGQKTKEAHTSIYRDYVQNLNNISSELDTANRAGTNSKHADFRSLKIDESYNLNAVWLHELYFANCYDPHSEIVMDSMPYIKLQRDFGTFEDWQRDFVACAMSAGNGWAVTGYHTYLRRYVNTFVSSHNENVLVGLYPVIVVDMWEHAYSRDYLTDKKSYLIAQMRELNWDVISERFAKSEAIAVAVK